MEDGGDVGNALRVLRGHLLSFGADVQEVDEAGLLKYRRGHARLGPVFCVVRVRTRGLDVAFRRFSRARSKRVLDAKAAGLPHLPYRVVVEAAGDVDAELLSWVRESYEISGE